MLEALLTPSSSQIIGHLVALHSATLWPSHTRCTHTGSRVYVFLIILFVPSFCRGKKSL